jgi:hypothetical protein
VTEFCVVFGTTTLKELKAAQSFEALPACSVIAVALPDKMIWMVDAGLIQRNFAIAICPSPIVAVPAGNESEQS